ncbi:MAG: CapA family protein [Candidatus Aenigmatarchaeota archaeon]
MKIAFIGDVMLGRLVNEVLKYEKSEYIWGDTLKIFKKADLRICNLECVISDKGEPWSLTPKVFHFRSDAKNVEVLKVANINLVSLANNHSLDFGYEAMFEMVEILKKNNIFYAGVGENLASASKPAILEINNIKIGFLAFTDNEPFWSAEKDKPGIFYVEIKENGKNMNYLLEKIKDTKKEVDYLIISAHWGPNWGYEPLKEHIYFAHKFIDYGADLIFGHSPHIFRGIEIYKNKFILYSTGDFVDDYAVDEIERNDESFIFVWDTEKNIFELYPTMIENFQARLAKDKEKEIIMAKMIRLCQKLKTKIKKEKDRLIINIKD